MMPEVNDFHLNIAEAFVEMQGEPISLEDLLPALELPSEVAQEIKVLAVQQALLSDGRFVNVGTAEASRWFLARMMPEQVVEPPPRLSVDVPACDRSVLTGDLLSMELEIDDENGLAEILGAVDLGSPGEVTVALNYPHWFLGTIPLTRKTRPLFPPGAAGQRTRVEFVDPRTKRRMEGWVVHDQAFVFGLRDWYEESRIPVGGLVTIQETDDPLIVQIKHQPRRMKRLWVRLATVEDGRLRFSMQKRPIYCEQDDLLSVWTEDSDGLEELWNRHQENQTPLEELLDEVFEDLAGLSPQGTVHAKTLYSAMNLIRRCPPGPLFAALVSNPAFEDVGGGFWGYSEA
jgi:hypothetical protein